MQEFSWENYYYYYYYFLGVRRASIERLLTLHEACNELRHSLRVCLPLIPREREVYM